MVPRPGFEPGTTASSGQRSPTELPGQVGKSQFIFKLIFPENLGKLVIFF